MSDSDLHAFYARVRGTTLGLAAPLSAEDCSAQSMPDASPAKWHLAHTTWFFETFVLQQAQPGYRLFHPLFRVLFNSYYNSVGEQHPRSQRGLLTRPPLHEVLVYREHVDEHVAKLFENQAVTPELARVIELGLHHEQQHQELLLMDVKHLLSGNPLEPAYRAHDTAPAPAGAAAALIWHAFAEETRWIGHGGEEFAFDNESPRHRVLQPAFELASRAVTNGEYRAFIEDGGYENPELWLSDGWSTIREHGWQAPDYWRFDGDWRNFGLTGPQPLRDAEPVSHVSFYEADAFARWAGARLPSEAEWEVAATTRPVRGNFLENERLRPEPAALASDGPEQLFGDVWEWTASAYAPYPGYQPPAGALGEYNGKFMANQMVLRGGSFATPAGHARPTYRNFFYPHQRWQFAGLRLARNT